MTNQKYVTGQRFKAKIQGVEVEGRIYVVEQDEIYLCQNIVRGVDDSPENFGYKHSWICSPKLGIDVTGLILLPDTEPQKGEYEGSDDGENWYKITDEYTGIEYKGFHIVFVENLNIFVAWKHIRLAKPIPTERELAEKKAREFFGDKCAFGDEFRAVVEYILKTQKS